MIKYLAEYVLRASWLITSSSTLHHPSFRAKIARYRFPQYLEG